MQNKLSRAIVNLIAVSANALSQSLTIATDTGSCKHKIQCQRWSTVPPLKAPVKPATPIISAPDVCCTPVRPTLKFTAINFRVGVRTHDRGQMDVTDVGPAASATIVVRLLKNSGTYWKAHYENQATVCVPLSWWHWVSVEKPRGSVIVSFKTYWPC